MGPLQIAFQKSIDEPQFDLYVDMLSDIHPETLKATVKEIIKTNNFFPTIAEIRRKAKEISSYVNVKPNELDPLEAWEQTYHVAKTYGYDVGLDKLTGVAKEAAKAIWHDLCYSPTDSVGITRAHFLKAFERLAKREEERNEIQSVLSHYPVLESARNKKLGEQMCIEQGDKKIAMLSTGNLVEVVKEPVDIEKVLGNLKPELQTIIRSVMKGKADERIRSND